MKEYTFCRVIPGELAKEELRKANRLFSTNSLGPYVKRLNGVESKEYIIPGFLWDNAIDPQLISTGREGEKNTLYVQVYTQGKTRILGDRINRRTRSLLKILGFNTPLAESR